MENYSSYKVKFYECVYSSEIKDQAFHDNFLKPFFIEESNRHFFEYVVSESKLGEEEKELIINSPNLGYFWLNVLMLFQAASGTIEGFTQYFRMKLQEEDIKNAFEIVLNNYFNKILSEQNIQL